MSWLAERKSLPLVILAVVLHLVLISAQVRNPDGHTLLRTLGVAVISPLALAVSAAADSIEGALNRYVILFGVQERNEELEAEVGRLRLENAQLRSVQSMLSRSTELQILARQHLFETTMATIIWKTAPFFSHRLGINVGTRHGVKRNLAVIGLSGIIGRVVATTPMSSEVELVTNRGASAGAMLSDSRLQGVLQGDGSDLLEWKFIPNHESVDVGELVYTSGTDRIYPKGIPVGRVVTSEKGEMVHRNIKVEPFVDFSKVEEVLVARLP